MFIECLASVWVWKFFHYFRPEVKENKEGADTEKAAEQSAEPEELVKEKVRKFN